MILKTYTRVFTHDLDATLAVLEPLHRGEPHVRFRFGDWDLVGIGDILVVAGTEESLAPIRGSLGPWVVEDLEQARDVVLRSGGVLTQDIQPAPTGRFFYARHVDGNVVEYVQWTPELVETFVEAPRREGRLASQL